jgi:hypothetical protein
MYKLFIIIATVAAVAIVAGIIPLSTIFVQTNAQQATQLPVFPQQENETGGVTNETAANDTSSTNNLTPAELANVDVVQQPNIIVITVTPQGYEVPEGPIIVPDPGAGDNGTIIVPDNNDTIVIVPPVNESEPEPQPPIVIEDGNITRVDNDTIIIAPDNETITETPGNVTVIDPPAPQPCGCPPAAEVPSIPPVLVTPAPGQNVTTGEPEAPAAPAPEPEAPVASGENETGGEFPTQLPVFPPAAENNETIIVPSPGENITVTPAPSENDTEPVAPSQLPASSLSAALPWMTQY